MRVQTKRFHNAPTLAHWAAGCTGRPRQGALLPPWRQKLFTPASSFPSHASSYDLTRGLILQGTGRSMLRCAFPARCVLVLRFSQSRPRCAQAGGRRALFCSRTPPASPACCRRQGTLHCISRASVPTLPRNSAGASPESWARSSPGTKGLKAAIGWPYRFYLTSIRLKTLWRFPHVRTTKWWRNCVRGLSRRPLDRPGQRCAAGRTPHAGVEPTGGSGL